MKLLEIENLCFSYPKTDKRAIDMISFDVKQGEFILLCGKSGSGKSTLLRLIKKELAPIGTISGKIYFCGKETDDLSPRETAEKIGLVFQNPDTHIVSETVSREMAFGLENLSFPSDRIKCRVAEMASYFGLCADFNRETHVLSGGKKQLLSLACAMSCDPQLLLLDEPTSRLDPIAAEEFIASLLKLKNELGLTIIISEHRLENLLPCADRIIMLEDGKVSVDAPAKEAVKLISKTEMSGSLPTPAKLGLLFESETIPLTVSEGMRFAKHLECVKSNYNVPYIDNLTDTPQKPILEACSLSFKYTKNSDHVLKSLNCKFHQGKIYSILGANGVGKSTLLSCLSGLESPTAGKIKYLDKNISKYGNDLWKNNIVMLMQDAQIMFSHEKIRDDLESARKRSGASAEKVEKICNLLHTDKILEKHPYDLSGGEIQRAALSKLLIGSPKVLLLDEPTQGLDAFFKQSLAEILRTLAKEQNMSVIMASHDLEFCATISDYCSLMFDGSLSQFQAPNEFFPKNRFYTTATCRIMRDLLPFAVCFNDIQDACDCKVISMRD